LPLALTLIRPELDAWAPGCLASGTLDNGALLEESLRLLAARYDGPVTEVRGRGMAWGIAFSDPDLAGSVRTQAFSRGLILETFRCRTSSPTASGA
jgi:diaminobutyrate-2-oxoglutarate transaminase